MTKKAMLLCAALLLLVPLTLAVDTNSMTTEQLQAYIQQLQNNAQPQQQIISVQMDEQLRQKLDLLVEEIKSLKESSKAMENRFGKLVTDTDIKIQESEKRTIEAQNTNMIKLLEIQDSNFKEYVQLYTNPLRMNLPAIGVFLMLTAAFLLWASKQYKLTEGVRLHGRK